MSRLMPSKKSAAAVTLVTCALDSGTGVESWGACEGEPDMGPEWESWNIVNTS